MIPIIGFRIWRVEPMLTGPRLASPFRHILWVAQEPLRAECWDSVDDRLPKAHKEGPDTSPPLEDCSCGIYAYHDPEQMLGAIPHDSVGGAVLCWGRVIIHNEGVRAQFARPLALARCESMLIAARDQQRLAMAYGVPLLKAANLALYAHEFGQTVKPAIEPSTTWYRRFFGRWFHA